MGRTAEEFGIRKPQRRWSPRARLRTQKLPGLYRDLAEWFPLLTPPEEYRKEAAFYRRAIRDASHIPVKTVLELGSGGGNNASHLKSHFAMTLTDLSGEMLRLSRGLNPECEHLRGDMRDLRLGRQFDAVFAHDAVGHLAAEGDLARAIETAFVHLKPGGSALFAPDYLRETFEPSTQHGGHDAAGRGLRYLEWTWDPDPADTNYIADLVYLLRERDRVLCRRDRLVMGLFSGRDWRRLLAAAGFSEVTLRRYPAGLAWPTPVIIGVRPGRPADRKERNRRVR